MAKEIVTYNQNQTMLKEVFILCVKQVGKFSCIFGNFSLNTSNSLQ